MIRFCDKEVKEIYYKDMTRSQMLLYFLQSEKQRRSVIFIYDDEKYCGMVTYQDILAHTELNDCINEKVFIADDNLWNEAKQEFDKAKHPLYPIVSDEGELLSFIYNDELKNYEYYIGFVQFEKAKELPISFEEWQPDCKIICIVDFNEWAFRLYNALRRLGVNVCVIGEKWEWFGISQKENLNNYMEWEVFYFYAEGKVNNKKQLMSGIGYESIWNEYSVLWEWERRCFYHYYKVFAEFLLQNDVAVVSVSLPDSNDKSFYLTKDELENIYYGIEAVYQTKFATQQQLENMKKICGTKEVERIMDKNYVETYEIDFNVSDWNYITFNEISAMTMGDTDAKRIWLIGPCIAFGFRNFQENSLVTLLNNLVKDNGYSVVRVAVSCGNFTVFKEEYEKLPIREQDIVVLLGHKSDMELMPGTHIDLKDLYDDTTRENWITNGESFHTNKYGNKAIADAIYERYLKSKIHEKTSKKTNKYVQKGEILSDDLQDKVKEYVEEIIINNNK